MYEVIVIGGGPVGSSVAYRLAAAGYRVVVLEKREKPGGKVCCTGIVSQQCVSSWAISDSVILRRVNSGRVVSPSGKLLKLWRPETQACIVDRAAFDLALARRAQGEGVEYQFNTLATDLAVSGDGVKVIATSQGERLNLMAKAVVIATGFGSALVNRLGLGQVGDLVRGAQVEVEGPGVEETEVYLGQGIAPGFFGWLVPTSPERALVGLLSRHRPELYLRKLITSLTAQGKIAPTESKPSYGGIPLKPLSRTYGERLVVVGDAAGQVKPTTGGGIYYGLLCADIAASVLHQALASDDLSARSLSRYERGWKQRLGWDLKVGYWARRLYERLSDRQIEQLFDIIMSQGIDKAILEAKDLSFDGHGEIIWRLLKHGAVTGVIGVMKAPFRKERSRLTP